MIIAYLEIAQLTEVIIGTPVQRESDAWLMEPKGQTVGFIQFDSSAQTTSYRVCLKRLRRALGRWVSWVGDGRSARPWELRT